MKKIIALTAALMMASLSAFALDITVGARGNFNMGLGTTLESDNSEYWADKTSSNIGGGFGVYANFGLLELGGGSLGVQPEFDMNFNNGMSIDVKSVARYALGDKLTFTDSTIDIPVLVTFTYPVMDALSIGGGLGPYISIPFGLDQISKSGDNEHKYSEDFELKAKMNFGLAFDVNGAYKVGPGSIVLDLRYMLDLTSTTASSKNKSYGDWGDYNEIITRRLLAIGVGYQIKF